MQASTTWFPDPRVLLLLYQPYRSNRKILTKAIRKWVFTQIILDDLDQNISEEDKIVLTLTTFLSPLKFFENSNKELPEKELEQKLGNKIDSIFPDISSYINSKDLATTLVSVIVKTRGITDEDNSATIVNILKDSERIEISDGFLRRLKESDLKLESSKNSLEQIDQIKQEWKRINYDISDPFLILNKLEEKFSEVIVIPELIKQYSKEPYRSNLLTFSKGRAIQELTQFEKSLKELAELEDERSINRLIKEIRTSIYKEKVSSNEQNEDLNQVPGSNNNLDDALKNQKEQIFLKMSKEILTDKVMNSRNFDIIMRTRKKIRDDLSYQQDRSSREEKDDEKFSILDIGTFAILHEFDIKNDKKLLYTLMEYLAFNSEIEKLEQLIALITPPFQQEGVLQKPLYNNYNKINASDRVFTKSETSWVWVRKLQKDQALIFSKLANSSKSKQIEQLNDLILITFSILEHNELYAEQVAELLKIISEVIEKADDAHIPIEHQNIYLHLESLYSGEFKKLNNEQYTLYKNLDTFKNTSYMEIIDQKILWELILIGKKLSEHNINTTPLFEDHIIPSILIKNEHYDLNELKEQFNEIGIRSNIWEKALKSEREKNGLTKEKLIKISLSRSEENLDAIIDRSKYKVRIDSKDKYRLVKEINDLEVLLKIFEEDNLCYIEGFDISADEVSERVRNETIMKRFLFRDSDGEEKENILAQFENLNDLFTTEQEISDQITYISKKNGNYLGNITMIFDESVSEDTIFTTHYPIGREIAKPFAHEDAKYLYEKIKDERIEIALERSKIFSLKPEEIYVKGYISTKDRYSDIIKGVILPKSVEGKEDFELLRQKAPEVKFYFY